MGSTPRFTREIFLEEPEDCEWLRTTHLKHVTPPPFESFVLAGNEDCPARLDLYALRRPDYNHKPIAVFERNEDGDMVLQPKE